MKNLLVLLVFFLAASVSVTAQKSPPPEAAVTTFNQMFKNVEDLKWKQEKNGEWEAEFESNEVEMSANFSADGKWLETETEIKVAELPAPVQSALKGKKVKEAAKIEKSDGAVVFEAELRRKEMLYDANGNFLSEAKD
jgi:Putative beta-lactamase-inhibitor-like, PepSY-like